MSAATVACLLFEIKSIWALSHILLHRPAYTISIWISHILPLSQVFASREKGEESDEEKERKKKNGSEK